MIALIAGTGALPGVIVGQLRAQGQEPLICYMDGFEPDVPRDLARVGFRIETLGTLIATLQAKGVTEVCLAGAVRRPEIDASRIDAATMPLVPRLMGALSHGDDGALRVILSLFEEAGMAVRAAHDIAPDLLPVSGVATNAAPSADHKQDANAGQNTVAGMGFRDSGQACVIRDGQVIAEEGPDGTDAMIARLCLPDADPDAGDMGIGSPIDVAISTVLGVRELFTKERPTPLPAEGAILFKAPKPQQDRRVDLPVIGPQTARGAAEAGMAGIVIEAGGVMVMEIDTVIDFLNANNMFLWVRPKS